MRLAGHSWADIAATLRLPVAAVADRGAAIVDPAHVLARVGRDAGRMRVMRHAPVHRLRPQGLAPGALHLPRRLLVYNVARWAFVGDLAPRRTRTGSSTSSSRRASPSSPPCKAPSTRPLASPAQLRLSRRSVRRAARLADVALPPLTRALPRPAQHRRRDLAHRRPDLRALPGRAPAAAGLGFIDMVSQQPGVGSPAARRSSTTRSPPSRACTSASPPRSASRSRRPAPSPDPGARARWGPLVSLAVVATGNHSVFDIAVGLPSPRSASRRAGLRYAAGLRPTALTLRPPRATPDPQLVHASAIGSPSAS